MCICSYLSVFFFFFFSFLDLDLLSRLKPDLIGRVRIERLMSSFGSLFTVWVIFLIQKEMSNYIYLRQNYLTSQHHIDLPQSRTVLVTGVPKQYLSVTALKKLTASLPGGIRRIWIARELKRLPELYNDRLKFTSMLESAETKLCKAAIKHHQRQLKQLEHSTQSQPSLIPTTTLTSNRSSDIDPHSENPVNKLVNRKHRPTHRLGFIGCFGKKVDTVDWCKDEIVRLTKEIEEERKRLDKHPPHNSALWVPSSYMGKPEMMLIRVETYLLSFYLASNLTIDWQHRSVSSIAIATFM